MDTLSEEEAWAGRDTVSSLAGGQKTLQLPGATLGSRAVLTATPSLPTHPSLLIPLTFPPSVLSPQIETSQLEPEIARATSSRTVVYNKGL